MLGKYVTNKYKQIVAIKHVANRYKLTAKIKQIKIFVFFICLPTSL